MELTVIQTALVVCIYFFGVFSCKFATQFFEVSHASRLVHSTVYRCLLMCATIQEDVAFLKEIKYKHMESSDLNRTQIQEFKKIDNQIMNSWKESVIQNIVMNTPRTFSFIIKFTNWQEAMRQLKEMHTDESAGK